MRARHVVKLVLDALPLVRRYRGRHMHRLDTPFAFSFLVTSRCTLRCRHCFYHEADVSADRELTLDEYARLSRSLDDFVMAVFCGGEPFMRRDLAEIVGIFRSNNQVPLAGVATNGQLTSSILRQTEAVVRADPEKPFTVSMSLDGFRETHDHIRGEGTFDRAQRTWEELGRLARHHPNLILTLTAVLSAANQDECPSFLRWVRETMAPAGINVLLVRQSPRDGDGMKRVDPRRYREAQHEALAALPRIGLPGRGSPHVAFMESIARGVAGTMHSGRRGFHCHAGVHGAMVDPEGEVNACEVLSEQKDTRSMGNLRDHDMDFGALWNSPRAARIRGCVNRHAACRACTHETMGYAPSLLFAPNRIRRSVPPRRTVGERLREATGRVRDACAPPAAMEVTT